MSVRFLVVCLVCVAGALVGARAAIAEPDVLSSSVVANPLALGSADGLGMPGAAVGGAGGFDAGSPGGGAVAGGLPGVEVQALRTATSRTYRTSGGQMATVVSSAPVNYRDGAGAWRAIDDRLVVRGGAWQNVGGPAAATFPVDLAAGDVRLRRSGASVAFRLRGVGAGSVGVVSGDTATYAAVLPSTDVSLQSRAQGVKETLTLTDAGAPSVFSYDLSVSAGLELALQRDGSLVARRRGGAVRFSIPAPTVRDARGVSGAAHYVLWRDGAGVGLRLVVDRAWLAAAGRSWPVVVDPSLDVVSPSFCTLVLAQPNTQLCSAAGATSESFVQGGVLTDDKLGLLKWDLSSIPRDARIDHGFVNLQVQTSSLGVQAVSETATAYPVAATSPAWDSTATWSNAKASPATPWPSGGQLTRVGGVQFAAQGVCQGYDLKGQCDKQTPGVVQNLDVTSFVQQWAASGNFGMGIANVTLPGAVNSNVTLTVPNLQSPSDLLVYWHLPTGRLRQFQYDSYDLNDVSSASVNVSSGDLEYTNTDLSLTAPGLAFTESRLYDSMRTSTPLDLSLGWKFSVGRETTFCSVCDKVGVADGPDGVVYHMPPATAGVKAANGQAGAPAIDGEDATLTLNPIKPNFPELMYNQSGVAYLFGANNMLESITNRDGRGWYVSEYTPGCGAMVFAARRTDDGGQGNPGYVSAHAYASCGGQVTQITDSTGRTWQYGYNANGLLTTYTDPNNKTTTYGYTQYGTGNPATNSLLSSITTPGGRVTTISYLQSGQSNYQFGRVASVTQKIDATHNAVTTYAYGFGAAPCTATEGVTTTVDPAGRTKVSCFDALGRPTHSFDDYRQAHGAGGDWGNDSDGVSYGAQGTLSHPTSSNPAGRSGPASLTSSYGFAADSTGNDYGDAAPAGEQTHATFTDSSNPYLPTTVTDAQGNVQRRYYTSTGHVSAVNALVLGVPQPEQISNQWSGGLLQSTTLGGITPQGVYDTTTYQYDSLGNVHVVIPPLGQSSTTYTYDALNRVQTKLDGRGKLTAYGYDPDGRTTSITWSDGSGIRYTYDGDGLLTQRVACVLCGQAGETDQTSTYTYDGLGDRMTAVTPGIPATVAVPGGSGQTASIVYSYNPDQSLGSIKDAGGAVNYAYNNDGLLKSVSDPSTTPSAVQFSYDLDDPLNSHPLGLLNTVTYPNATHTGTSLTNTYSYDNDGRITTLQSKKTGQSTPLQSWAYDYTRHVLGGGSTGSTALRQWIIDSSGQATGYKYDYLNRLTQLDTYASSAAGAHEISQYKYCYNACAGHTATEESRSNILQKSYTPYTNGVAGTTINTNTTYDTANDLLTIGGTAVNHDQAGNNTGHASLGGDQTQPGSRSVVLQFNAADQLSEIDTPLSAGGAVTPTALTYDDATNDDVTVDGATKLENTELGISATLPGGTPTYFTRTPDGGLLDSRNASNTQYYLADDRGSVVGTTNTAGTLTQANLISYSAWGKTTATPPTFGYLGAYQEPGGLDHFGQRYYDPSTGTWTQPDPVSQSADLVQANPYTYAGDDPVNQDDTAGTCVFDKDVSPIYYYVNGYSYFELCKKGKRAGFIGIRAGYVRKVKRVAEKHGVHSVCQIMGVGADGIAVGAGFVGLATTAIAPPAAGPLFMISAAFDLAGVALEAAHGITGC
ncbi:MAG TPA: RHS repeat-associated core domain-containing protein [Solirubrobacteraceae bacterium]|nr:RHS repeat-associated core domain-containing protein [Solirubrobacteraceae bacterium]